MMQAFQYSSLNIGLEGCWNLDETSGTRADSSRNGYTLTDNNSTASVAAANPQLGNAANFVKASNTYLSRAAATVANLTQTAGFSLTCWVNLTSNAAQAAIVTKGTIGSTGTSNYSLAYIQSTNKFRITARVTTAAQVSANFTPSLATWYFIAVTCTAPGTLAISVNNGTPTTTAVGGALANSVTNDFVIGASTDASNVEVVATALDAAVDDVCFYSKILTTEEISRKYANGHGRQQPNL